MGQHDFEPALPARHALELPLAPARPRAFGGALLVLLAGTLLGSCRSRGSTQERSADAAGSSSASAPAASSAALVADPEHDFGRVTQGDTLRHVFVTHNRASSPLALDEVREVLGCAGAFVPSTLAPNQRGELRVTCRASIHGPLRVSLPLRAAGRPAGEVSLRAEVEPLLAFERALLELSAPFGRADEAGARLRGKLAASARLTPAAPAPSGTDVRVLPAADGAPEGVLLRLARPAVGVHAGTLRFHTGLREVPTIELPYSVKVTGTLRVSPTNPVLDLAAPDGTRALITVTSSQPGFKLVRAEVVEGPFSARVKDAPNGYTVEVSLVSAKFPEGAHGANGRLRIVSNDGTEPTRAIQLFALGRPPRASAVPSR